MKKFKIVQVQKTREEHLKEIAQVLEQLKYKRLAIQMKYEDDMKAIEREINTLEEEREIINAEDT